MYKARLVSGDAMNYAEVEAVGSAVVEAPSWRVVTLKDSREQPPRYEVEFEYPFFVEVASDIREINDLERAVAVTRLQEFREGQFRAHAAEDDSPQSGSSFSSSFEVLCAAADVISIRHRLFHYGSGAAHPNHWTAVSNYQRNPVCAVQLRDLFSGVEYLSVLSRECIADLVEQKQLEEPTPDILVGAGPKEENFTRFNVSPEGLVINFDEYTVGSYVDGAFTVVIPRQAIAGILRPNAPISRYLLRVVG
jgi:hypothetical protein